MQRACTLSIGRKLQLAPAINWQFLFASGCVAYLVQRIIVLAQRWVADSSIGITGVLTPLTRNINTIHCNNISAVNNVFLPVV